MSNWKNIDGVWINFDYLKELWIEKNIQNKFVIYTKCSDETCRLSDLEFKTQPVAQAYLNNFMNE